MENIKYLIISGIGCHSFEIYSWSTTKKEALKIVEEYIIETGEEDVSVFKVEEKILSIKHKAYFK